MAETKTRAAVPVTAETLARVADEIVGTAVAEGDRKAVAALLPNLLLDMVAVRRMNVGEAEPALVYDAGGAEA